MKRGNYLGDLSFILSGRHRITLLNLLGSPKTPTQLKELTKLHFNSVSRTLMELNKKGLIECLNPSQKLVRFYRITKKGADLLKKSKTL